MASRNGYKLLKRTNEEDSDLSTSKPGPSSETQSEDQNDGKVRVISGPAILEPSQVESLRFDEIFAKKWTRSCPQISTTGDPRSTSVSSNDNRNNLESSSEESSQWSDSVGGDNRQELQPDGGEGGDNQQLQPDGGEGGDNQQLQPDGGEGGDNQQQPDGGEGGDNQQQEGDEPRSSCWKAFKKFYISPMLNLAKIPWFIYSSLGFLVFLAIANISFGFASMEHCRVRDESSKGYSVSTLVAGFCAVFLIISWVCTYCLERSSFCCKILAEMANLTLSLASFIPVVAELVLCFSTECGEEYDFLGKILLGFNIAFLIFGYAIYFPNFCCSFDERRVMEGQNGDCRHNELDENQV